MSQVVSLSFYRFGSVPARLWAFAMMGLARMPMARVPDIGFWKLCGSGSGEGFTPVPNTAVYAILATWPDLETAQTRTASAPIFQRYAANASEGWTVFLTTQSSRGEWAHESPFIVSNPAESGPLAVLTRATIKPSRALRFWKRVPRILRALATMPTRSRRCVTRVGSRKSFMPGSGSSRIAAAGTAHRRYDIWPDTTVRHES